MELWQAVVLGVVEGITEFLPVSSTGHLTIAEQLMGLPVDDPGVTAFTAIVQLGAIAAVLIYFRLDILALATAWLRGLRDPSARSSPEHRLAWYVIAGSVPIGVVGFALRDVVSGSLRSLWVVVVALIAWSVVMVVAERVSARLPHRREERELHLADALWVGVLQCVALVPGVSRSGATISAGLLRGLTRVTATRLSFFLSVPALVAAGAYEAASQASAVATTVGWGTTGVATGVALVTAYAAIAWLLRLVAGHPITVFVGYRVVLGVALLAALATGVMSPT